MGTWIRVLKRHQLSSMGCQTLRRWFWEILENMTENTWLPVTQMVAYLMLLGSEMMLKWCPELDKSCFVRCVVFWSKQHSKCSAPGPSI